MMMMMMESVTKILVSMVIVTTTTMTMVDGRPGHLFQIISPPHSAIVNVHNPYVVQPFHFLPRSLFLASPPLLQAEPEADKEAEITDKQEEDVQEENLDKGTKVDDVSQMDEPNKTETKEEDSGIQSGDETLSKSPSSEATDDNRPNEKEEKVEPLSAPNTKNQQLLNSVTYFQPTLSWTLQPLLFPFQHFQPALF